MNDSIRVAVDVGSRQHRVAVSDATGHLLDEFSIDHHHLGFSQFFDRVGRHGAADVRVAMEGFNGWARPLDQAVLARGWRLYNVNNLKLARYKEIFPAPAKTDAIDARRMLELFSLAEQRPLARNALVEIQSASAAQRQLKYLTRRRRILVTERAQRLVRLRVDLQAVCPDLLALTGAVSNRWFLRFLTCRQRLTALPRLQAKTIAALPGVGAKTAPRIRTWQAQATFGPDIDLYDADIVADAQAILELDERLNALNQRIEATAADCPMTQRLCTIPGFGPISAAELSGEIGNLSRFNSEASLALYLGMAPLDRSSGMMQRATLPKCVNTRCQSAMMTCVVRHMRCVEQSRTFYERKRSQGKRHNQAVRALGRHLTRVIWRMLTKQRDYRITAKTT